MASFCGYAAELCFCLARLCLLNAVTGTGATRTAFIFQAVIIVAYLCYLWGLADGMFRLPSIGL